MAFLFVPDLKAERAEGVEAIYKFTQNCDLASFISTISLLIGCLQTVESDIPTPPPPLAGDRGRCGFY